MTFKLSPPAEIATELGKRVRARRLDQKLTQQGLSERSGVALATLRNFERTGKVSLLSFVRLATALGDEKALEGLLLEQQSFTSLDDVLKEPKRPQRGSRS